MNEQGHGQRKRLGLVLSGGAAFGLAHIGVLQVLDEAGVRIDAVGGASVGALVGAAVAAGKSVREITQVAYRINWLHLARPRPHRYGFISFRKLEWLVNVWLGDPTFEDLALPFICVGTDVLTGAPRIFREGSVAHAVRISASVPPFVIPAMKDGRYYVDGGFSNNLPIRPVEGLGVDVTLAVNLFGHASRMPRNYFAYAQLILGHMLTRTAGDPNRATVLVTPNLAESLAARFHRSYIQAGREAMREKLPALLKALEG
jgi:NTE family protein